MLNDLRQSLPLHVLNIKESYRQMRKSEADFFTTKLSSASTHNYLTNRGIDSSRQTDTNKLSEQPAGIYQSPQVIFISSKAFFDARISFLK